MNEQIVLDDCVRNMYYSKVNNVIYHSTRRCLCPMLFTT